MESDFRPFGRVMLLKPICKGSHYGDRWLPTGLAYISHALNRAGIDQTVLDMGLGYDLEALKEIIHKRRPDLLGVSMVSLGYRYIYRMLEDLKYTFPELAIVVGGPHVSTLREDVLRQCPAIDFGVVLEGEETIIELCKGQKPYFEIKGLLYREEGGVIYTGDRPFIQDLDGVGFPTYSQFEMEKYGHDFCPAIVTSRGCPYNCTYCTVKTIIGRQFRMRSAKSVVDELEFLYAKGYRHIGIADDNFTLVRERIVEICNEIESRHFDGLKLSLGTGVRADKVDCMLLARMREVGFFYLAFGVEAGNNRILKRIRKGEQIEVIERAIADACDLGYIVTLFFLLGSPEETESDVHDSLNLALRYPVYDIRFYHIIPYPGTELFAWLRDNNYLLASPENYLNDTDRWFNQPVFETPELSRESRIQLYRQVNRKAYLHTLPVKRRLHLENVSVKFQQFGIPRWLSRKLSMLYFSHMVQLCLLTGMGCRLKVLFRLIVNL